ncbi:MAG: hypothetical protein HZA02_01055 [Nitrospinae bacterium]|nr:hypothetical protein [Nitrospinota bacterium]
MTQGADNPHCGVEEKSLTKKQVLKYAEDLAVLFRAEKNQRLRLEESNAQLKKYAEDLRLSHQELQDFLLTASHDLQEPLRKAVTFGDLLKTRFRQQLGPAGFEYIDRLAGAVQRMQRLLDDLSAYSRLTIETHPRAPANMGEVISDAVAGVKSQAEALGGSLKLEIQPNPVLEVDAPQIGQMFKCLVANGLKFRKRGVPPELVIRSRRTDDGKWEFTVRDNGIGFEEKYLDRIFKPFERLHPSGEYDGAGMGLTVCRKIVERHGGEITAKSSAGNGAAFFVVLPEKQSPPRS